MAGEAFDAALRKAVAGHTDLNIFAAVVTLLEGGHIYGTDSQRAVEKIISLCKAEQARSLALHDAGVAKLKRLSRP